MGLALNICLQDNENVFPNGIGPDSDNRGRWPYIAGATYRVHYLAPYYVSEDDGNSNAEAWLDP